MTVTPFADLGLSEPLLRAIQELGYEEPTPIQSRTIGVMLQGSDLIAQAQTGSGKTAAFALPIIERLDGNLTHIQALILTPTRELAVQVADACNRYARHIGIRALPIYGGQSYDVQLRALRRGVQIVVGTPGRLMDHMRRGTVVLDQVRTVVLDEADEMLNMGFIDDIEQILEALPAERQTALFSATMPDQIVALAQRHLREPQQISVQAEQLTVPQIRQIFYEMPPHHKLEALVRVLDMEMPTSAIVFCRTKAAVDELSERLNARGYSADALHGDLSQAQRDRVMKRFRDNQAELLIATDVAARGLDIEHVSHVINYDIPMDPEAYVHRIGRTGRAGRTGVAITLITPRERRMLHTIQRLTGSEIKRMRIPTIADVVARRRESFKDTIRELLVETSGLAAYLPIVEDLGEEYDPVDIAAAAFKLLLDEPTAPKDDAPLDAPERQQQQQQQQRDRRREERHSFGPEGGMTRIFINIGREERVRPADIVGAIANEAGLPGRAIGAIDLFDHFSFVEVPANAADRVLQALNNTSIRGQKIEATMAKPRRDGGRDGRDGGRDGGRGGRDGGRPGRPPMRPKRERDRG